MKIEERAEKFASVFPRSEQHFAEECYIQGATEQKEIDHEEWQKDMRYVNVRKQELIDKACQYLRDHIDPKLTIYHERTWMSLATFIDKFRKAIEE